MYKKSGENGIMKPTHTGDATVMPDRFSPQTDIRVLHRQDAVRRYMSPDVQQIQPHFHYQNEFLFTVGGTADFHISGKTYHVQSGSFLFVNNLENHYIISHSEGYDRYTVRFSNEALNTLIHDPLLLSIFKQRPSGFCHQYVCTPQEMKHYVLMLDIMTREYAEQAPYWDYLIASKLRDILIYMYRHQPNAFPGERGQSGQELIFNVQNYIESNFNQNLQLEEIADRFFISKYHLSHIFSSITGYPLKQYLIMVRLSKAKDLLLHTDQEIQQIAWNVGFTSASHFIRIFKSHEGLSPLQYRNRVNRPPSV